MTFVNGTLRPSANAASNRSLNQLFSEPVSMKPLSPSAICVKRRVYALHQPGKGFLSLLENGLIFWTRDPAMAMTWLDPVQAASRLRSCHWLSDSLPVASLKPVTLATESYPFLWRDDS